MLWWTSILTLLPATFLLAWQSGRPGRPIDPEWHLPLLRRIAVLGIGMAAAVGLAAAGIQRCRTRTHPT